MQADPLAELRGLHQPDAVGWWPLAPGWWVLMILVLAALTWYLVRAWLHKQRNLYRQHAREELDQLTTEFNQHQDKSVYLVDSHKLLRRVALHHYPNQQQDFAGLTGAEWQQFLNNCCEEKVFDAKFTEHFSELPYQQSSDYDQQRWQRAIYNWLEQHR